jgi:hypothetical protein
MEIAARDAELIPAMPFGKFMTFIANGRATRAPFPAVAGL